MMNNIRYIPLEEMETITQKILMDYGLNLNEDTSIPIPIEELIEFHFELDIQWENIDHFDSDGRVMAAIIPSERKIIMNETCKDLFEEKIGTMNFTFAHELGHWVLHANEENGQLSLSLGEGIKPFYCRSRHFSIWIGMVY